MLDLEREHRKDLAIFLHSSFRVSSTWLWSQFRRSDKVIAYYEIFHESLATIERDCLSKVTPTAWPSGHPTGPGYFLEFLPLIRDEGGVEGFDTSMGFAGFIPDAGLCGTLRESERAYITSLIRYAEQLHKTPVLSTKSLGRLRAIKAAFPGKHVLIYRNLFQQWCSYTEQFFLGNPYFLSSIRATIEKNQNDSFCRYLYDLFHLGTPSLDSVDYLCCFVLLHLYLYAQIAYAADLIIDVNHLYNNADYRHSIEQQIVDASGIEVDLTDVRSAIAFSFVAPAKSKEVLDQIKIIANFVIANTSAPEGRAFASKALEDFVEEYRRYHFYASRLVAIAGKEGLLGERDRLRAERDGLFGSTSWRLTAPIRALGNLFR